MSLDAERLKAMARVGLLAGCETETLARLASRAWMRVCAPGESLVRRGERVSCLHLLISGSLEVGITTAGGKHFVTSYLAPGQVFGLIPLLDDGGAIHDAHAHGACTLLLIPADDFHAAMQADVGLQRRVLRLMAGRSRRLYSSLTSASLLPLDVRLARLLLSLLAAYGTEVHAEGAAIGLRITQESLGAMLGVPRQRLNVELKAMERDAVVRLAYSRIVVIDEAALHARAGEPLD